MNIHLSTERLQDYLDGTLSAGEMEEIEGHLATCRKCNSTYKALSTVDGVLRSMHAEKVSPAFTQSLMQKVLQESQTPLSFKILEKLASVFALFLVLAVLVTVFTFTGVMDLSTLDEGKNKLQELMLESTSVVEGGIAAFSRWLVELAPFAFGGTSIDISAMVFIIIVLLALLDRVVLQRMVHRIRQGSPP
jgi:predicted anti-sigma-YlaC factor YlaD